MNARTVPIVQFFPTTLPWSDTTENAVSDFARLGLEKEVLGAKQSLHKDCRRIGTGYRNDGSEVEIYLDRQAFPLTYRFGVSS